MRLIDAEALKNMWLKDKNTMLEHGISIGADIIDGFIRDLDNAPTAEQKHGHWTIEDIVTYERSYGGTLYEPVYKCSCCGRVTESYVRGDEPIMPEDADFPKFCGNCGAKMDEVEE